MALARIITRSHPCSRELALDLLARGYAVEIVSPDSIPDNIADLELRVDAGPGDQLIANVEAHDGERSASLEFLHYLKAPMADFIRRPPEPGEAVHFPEQPVSINTEPSIEDMEPPAEAPQLAPKPVSSAAETLRDPDLDPGFDPGFDPEDGARLISPLHPLPSLPVETPSHFAAEAPTIAQPTAQPIVQPTIVQPTIVRPTRVRPVRESQQRGRFAEWFWRAALAFASVLLLALVLGFGMRRTGKTSAQSSGAVPAEKVAAGSTDVNLLSAPYPEKGPGKDPRQVSALAVSPPATKSEGNSDQAPKHSPVAKAGAANASPSNAGAQAKISRRHSDDLIAPDTVTYLDGRTVGKPASKAKPDSGIKHYSDLK